MKTIAISNQKGGIGKSTTSQILSSILADKGKRTLLLDLDPQCNTTGSLKSDTEILNIYEVFKGELIKDAIQTLGKIDFVNGSELLATAELEFNRTGKDYILKEALESVQDLYDYCILDTPPSLGVITINALTASDSVIIPATANTYSIQGIVQLNDTIKTIKKYTNKDLVVEGILLVQFENRTILSRELKQTIQVIADTINTKVFNTAIRSSVNVRESQEYQMQLIDYAPSCNAFKDYLSFATELLDGGVIHD